jgi:hypothetical protein
MKRVDDEVRLDVPGGRKTYVVIDVRYESYAAGD